MGIIKMGLASLFFKKQDTKLSVVSWKINIKIIVDNVKMGKLVT